MNKNRRVACVDNGERPRRLTPGEAAVVIIVVALATLLALAGQPLLTVIELLVGTGLITVHLAGAQHRQAPVRC